MKWYAVIRIDNQSLFVLLILFGLFLGWFCWVFREGVFFGLATNENSIVPFFLADED